MRDRRALPLPGLLAKYDATCPRCDEPIIARQTQVVYQRGVYIHCACASGADE